MNLFFNPSENRPTALIRCVVYILLATVFLGLPDLFFPEIVAYILRGVLVLGITYVMFTFVDRRSFSEAGLRLNSKWWIDFGVGTAIAAFVLSLLFLVQWTSGDVKITGFAWDSVNSQFWLLPVLIWGLKMISVGFYEELIMRGYLQKNITEGFQFSKITAKNSAIIAILISSAIFGFSHILNPNASLIAVINIFGAGIMLAIPFLLTGSLALPIGIHFSWNFFLGGIFGFKVSGIPVRNSLIQINQSGEAWWTGGNFGPEAGVIGVLAMAILLFLTLIYIKISHNELKIHSDFINDYATKKAK